MGRRAALALLLAALSALAAAAHAAAPVAAERVLQMIYGAGLYESEVDRLLRAADGTPTYGALRAQTRALTRAALLAQRDAVLRDASGRVAAMATDAQLAALARVAAQPDAPADPAVLDPAVAAVKRGFTAAAAYHLARLARSNADLLCRKGDRRACP